MTNDTGVVCESIINKHIITFHAILTENRCGWYSVPNSSYVPYDTETGDKDAIDSFGGTK